MDSSAIEKSGTVYSVIFAQRKVRDIFGSMEPEGYIAIVALFVLLAVPVVFLIGQLFFLHIFLSNFTPFGLLNK